MHGLTPLSHRPQVDERLPLRLTLAQFSSPYFAPRGYATWRNRANSGTCPAELPLLSLTTPAIWHHSGGLRGASDRGGRSTSEAVSWPASLPSENGCAYEYIGRRPQSGRALLLSNDLADRSEPRRGRGEVTRRYRRRTNPHQN